MTYRTITRFIRKYESQSEKREVTYVYWKIFLWKADGKKVYSGTARTLRDALERKKFLLKEHPDLLGRPPKKRKRLHTHISSLNKMLGRIKQ